MAIYKKESLEHLKQKIDLAEVVSSHIELQRAGSAYKALCPFHEEKTPSFMINKGDSHYHCFGCGAHGDAISFLMGHLKMGFIDAIEYLAERFHVPLELQEEDAREKGPSKAALRESLEKACHFFHFFLLYSEEGRDALNYLYQRGIDLTFIKSFQIGYAPKNGELFLKMMHAQGMSDEVLQVSGLESMTSYGKRRSFFSERITFPIRDVSGNVIGFSARKMKEEVFGGKYINTPETPLFKKSQILFGLSYCRTRLTKERKVIVVEGQIDALRLIHLGFNYTVAGQGTAFGEGHVKELLHLGVNKVYLALDADNAGQEATSKIGHLFQKKGVEVFVIQMPPHADPDTFLREYGPEAFTRLIEESKDYLTFLFSHLSKRIDLTSPSQKNACVEEIGARVRQWEHSVMIHESLKKLAHLADVPEKMLGVGQDIMPPEIYIKKSGRVTFMEVDPDRVLETDLLRWLFLIGQTMPRLVELVEKNLNEKAFKQEVCQKLFSFYMEAFKEKKPLDVFSMAIKLESPAEQLILQEILQKKVHFQKAEVHLVDTIQKLLQRRWMEEAECIREKIESGNCTDEEALVLAKQFDELKKTPPIIN